MKYDPEVEPDLVLTGGARRPAEPRFAPSGKRHSCRFPLWHGHWQKRQECRFPEIPPPRWRLSIRSRGSATIPHWQGDVAVTWGKRRLAASAHGRSPFGRDGARPSRPSLNVSCLPWSHVSGLMSTIIVFSRRQDGGPPMRSQQVATLPLPSRSGSPHHLDGSPHHLKGKE